MAFIRFMSTPAGRGIRVAMGVGFIAAGLQVGGGVGWGLAAFGMLPLVTGAANICPISPFIGEPLRGGCGRDDAACSS